MSAENEDKRLVPADSLDDLCGRINSGNITAKDLQMVGLFYLGYGADAQRKKEIREILRKKLPDTFYTCLSVSGVAEAYAHLLEVTPSDGSTEQQVTAYHN